MNKYKIYNIWTGISIIIISIIIVNKLWKIKNVASVDEKYRQ